MLAGSRYQDHGAFHATGAKISWPFGIVAAEVACHKEIACTMAPELAIQA